MFLRTEFNYDRDQASLESGIEVEGKSLTQQHQAVEADINTIVKRFGVTGVLPQSIRLPTYGDFSEVTDFFGAQLLIAQANQGFMQLPPNIRAAFGNNPGALINSLESAHDNPAVRSQLEELGILVKPDNSIAVKPEASSGA